MKTTDLQLLQDPYVGYTSCLDTARVLSAANKDNQAFWFKRSEDIIRDFINHLDQYPDFQSAYTHLAKMRHRLAVELHHRSETDLTGNYGFFRQEGEHYRVAISAGEGESSLKWQKKKIFELTNRLIDKIKHQVERANSVKAGYEDESMLCVIEKISDEARTADYYSISIKSPYLRKNNTDSSSDVLLSTIELYDFDKQKEFNQVRIEYTPIVASRMVRYQQILNVYYQSLMNWQEADGVTAYLDAAANIAFILSHLTLVKQGNAGITEWIIRAIAYKNHLKLGEFDHHEEIRWDFKAILTPNKSEYVRWFIKHVFKDNRIIDKSLTTRLFSFL